MSSQELTPQLLIGTTYTVCCCMTLVLMILGISLFYSGLTQRRSSFSVLSIPILISPIIFVDWFIWGYSLCYSPSQNKYIGNLSYVGLHGLQFRVMDTNRGEIIALTHFIFNGLFKIIAATLAFPCIAERGRVGPMMVFAWFWSVLVFNPITYWHWNTKGWLYNLPTLEFSGALPIHCVSGVTSFCYSMFLGKRNQVILRNYKNSSSGFILIGTFFCIIGWMGFNSGCVYKVSYQTLIVLVNTLVSGFVAGFSWLLIDFYTTRKLSMIGYLSGLISGLVVITSGAGYVPLWSSFIFGVIGGTVCNLSTRIKYWVNVDDSLDIFAIHGIGGIVGSLLTGLFASKHIAGDSIKGGWIDHHYIQLLYQLIGSVSTVAYVFCMSFTLLFVINIVPGLHIRLEDDLEIAGTDENQFGDFFSDYIEFLRILDPEEFVESKLD